MKFSVGIQKLKATDLGRARGHNLREHSTESQLPQSAWFHKTRQEQSHVGYRWNEEIVNKALSLSKRKDAVVAISLSFQVGKQSDWRHPPNTLHPFGQPKNPLPVDFYKLINAAFNSLSNEFSIENIVSVVIHYDESSPHIQCIVVPIKDNKLQAKNWLDGANKCGSLLERFHAEFIKTIPCDYVKKSGIGGEAHDKRKRAGGELAAAPTSLLDVFASRNEISALKKRVAELEKQSDAAFVDRKYNANELNNAHDMLRKLRSEHIETSKELREAEKKVQELEIRVEELTPKPAGRTFPPAGQNMRFGL